MDSIQLIYIALFGRPADPAGLAYFAEQTNNGQDLTAIADLSGTDEYQRRFEGDDDATVIIEIYQELFGRTPSFAEVQYWVGQMENNFDINDVAIAIAQSAQNEDAAILEAKVEAANQFTAAVQADPEAFAAYRGAQGEEFGRAFLNQIDSSDDVLTDEQVQAQVEAFGNNEEIPGIPGTVGETFTLTAASNPATGGVDEIEGTGNNDTFRAVIADSLDTTDILEGGAGTDVLNISAGALSAAAGTNAPIISDIERINNASTTAFDLAGVSGAEQIWSTGASADYDNADLSTVFGASLTAAGTINIDVEASTAGASDTLQLAVDDNNGNTATFTSTADAATIENISIAALGGAGAGATGDAVDDLANIDAFTAAKTLTVTGSGDIVVTAGAIATLTTVNASAASGAVTINATGAAQAVTFTGGSGVDTFYGGAGNDIINGGAGNDILLGQNGNDVIAGGAGADTMTGGAGTDTFVIETASAQLGDIDFVNDFAVADDSLDFNGPVGSAANFLSNATNAASFNDARELAEGVFDGTVQYYAIDNGTNTWVFFDADRDGTADAAVQLTGLADATGLTAADFVA
jgi:Ca2+-binding RTX toxin-like protein